MIRTPIGVVCSDKEAADYLREKYGIRQPRGVPFIRDYPTRTLGQARYSLALLRRQFQCGLHSANEYAEINARIRRAIAVFERGLGVVDAGEDQERQRQD
jgi:hypothetical protein